MLVDSSSRGVTTSLGSTSDGMTTGRGSTFSKGGMVIGGVEGDTGGKGVFTLWVHGEFVVISEPNTHWVHGGYF